MRFLIMNGAGNRFAVFDARTSDSFALNPEKVAAICKPGSSVMGELGADQLIVMRAPKDSTADVFMEIWNQKGFEVDACGNATRCVGWLVMTESGAQACTVQTNDALLHCTLAGTHQVAVDMGKPKLDWEQIPLEEVMHTHHVDVKIGPIDDPILSNPGAVNMGNPHCVFFVDDFEKAKPHLVGPMVEFHPLFPQQANVGFARIDAPDKETKVITLGCRLNAYESDVISGHARDMDLKNTVVINTCAVTGEAVRQSRQAVRRARKDSPEAQIIVTGCAAQIDPAAFANMPARFLASSKWLRSPLYFLYYSLWTR